MKKYIALLRGINVGGKNKIAMSDLKSLFSNNDFKNVVTYINSGNIIFASNIDNKEEIRKKCELIIADYFKLNIAVAIISSEDLINALKNAPKWWDNDELSKHNAIFVIPPLKASELVEQVKNSEYEQISNYDQIIFWSAPINTFSKTKLTKIVHNNSNNITVRNANTTKKLLELINK